MPRAKVAVSLDEVSLARLDRLVSESVFPNRSRAIQVAVDHILERMDRDRLARECSRLRPEEEKAMAEEGLMSELPEWPKY